MAEILRSNHVHPLKLIGQVSDCSYYCSDCNQLGFGAAYTCKRSCNFFLHPECVTASIHAIHPFSQTCELELRHTVTGRHSCDACGKTVQGLHYKCTCPFIVRYLHPFCLQYSRSLEASEGLTLYLNKTATSRCLHCNKKDLSWGTRGWAYVSENGTYCYHVACMRDRNINNDRREGFFKSLKAAMGVLSAIFQFFIRNPSSLVGALRYFSICGTILIMCAKINNVIEEDLDTLNSLIWTN